MNPRFLGLLNRVCRGSAASVVGMALLVSQPSWSQDGSVWRQTLEQGGVTAQIALERDGGAPLQAGEQARLHVTLTTTHDGKPLPRVLPGLWLDAANAQVGEEDAQTCQNRINRYVRANSLNPQALADFNGYDVLALNADASISVLDPRTQFAGKTSLRAVIELPGPGFDWVASPDDTQLFVSVPSRAAVAVANLLTFKTTAEVGLPGPPGRLRLHPGGEQVWAGVSEDSRSGSAGGVAVMDVKAPHRMRWLPLDRGHVEFAFDPAGWAAVTQRNSGALTFVDPTTLQTARVVRLPEGAMPLGVVFDTVGRRFVVSDARSGRLLAFDHRGESLGAIELQPGIGPLALSEDGRWLLVANPGMHQVSAVDLAGWRLAHQLPVSGRPFDLGFTSGYAYVRALDTEAVTLVALDSLASTPRLQHIAMGERPPGRTPQLPLASQLVPMPGGGGSFVASPGDNAVYYYMEGMNAAAGSVSARGHEARAVRVVRRGLREVAPGEFELMVTLPAAPKLLLAMATENPRTTHCLPLRLQAAAKPAEQRWQLSWDVLPSEANDLVLRLSGVPGNAQPSVVRVKLFQPGRGAWEVEARSDGAGRYKVRLPALAGGLWYAHPQPPRGSGAQWSFVSFVRKEQGS